MEKKIGGGTDSGFMVRSNRGKMVNLGGLSSHLATEGRAKNLTLNRESVIIFLIASLE